MKNVALPLALCAALSLASCARSKPVYEYKTLDRTNEPRVLSADGKNEVIREMGGQGWELTDSKMAVGTRPMVFRREKK